MKRPFSIEEDACEAGGDYETPGVALLPLNASQKCVIVRIGWRTNMRGPAYPMILWKTRCISGVKQLVRHSPHAGFADPLKGHISIRSYA